MRLVFGVALFAATLSNAVSLPRPKPLSGPGFIQLPVTAVNKSVALNQKRQASTPLYNPDYGLDYIVHSKHARRIPRRITDTR
jgi:hypothetical protein